MQPPPPRPSARAPQPLLVQSRKVRRQGKHMGGWRRADGRWGLSPSLWEGGAHDIFTHRLWQSRFHCWCRVSEGAKHSLTAPVLS